MSTKSNAVVQKTMATFDDAKRTLARLMARENITVQYIPGAKTAKFDVVSRVLTIPQWQNLSVDQFDLLVAHEVGHALYSDESFIKSIVKDRGLKSYFNVVEDARIERKMKQSFPGLKKIFVKGYGEFHQNGPLFKGTRTHIERRADGSMKSIKSMMLIDRINLHFKLTAASVDIPFTAEERKWLDAIESASSVQDALDIAKALHKLAKEKKQEQKQNKQDKQDSEESDDSQDDDSQDSDDESDDSADSDESDDSADSDESDDTDEDEESDSKSKKNDSEDDSSDDSDDDADASDSDDESDESDDSFDSDSDSDADSDDESDDDSDSDTDEDTSPESDTDKQFTDAMNELGENAQDNPTNKIRHVLLSPLSDAILRERVMSAAEWATECETALNQKVNAYGGYLPNLDEVEKQWNDTFLSTAKLMALEFERRKSARAFEHAKVSKTGRLNMAKLHAYKFAEDIFVRSMALPQGKSHGIVMLIDGSSSMDIVFRNVIDQVLLFAHFAKQVKIPFEAYVFTNKTPKVKTGNVDMGSMTVTIAEDASIIGLVNTMDKNFKKQVRSLLAMKAGYVTAHVSLSQLTGTPLHSGILLAERMVAKMKANYKLDKVMFVCISDGDDNSGIAYRDRGVDAYGNITSKMTTTGYYGNAKSTSLVMRDTLTKKNLIAAHQTTDGTVHTTNTLITAALLDSIRDRHDCRTIYLYLVGDPTTPAANTANAYLVRENANAPKCDSTTAMAEITKTGQFVVPEKNAPIADLAIVVRVRALEMTKANFANTDTRGMDEKQIAAAFVKEMKAAKANKVFVNTVVPFLS